MEPVEGGFWQELELSGFTVIIITVLVLFITEIISANGLLECLPPPIGCSCALLVDPTNR